MVSFYNVFVACNETATIHDVIGKYILRVDIEVNNPDSQQPQTLFTNFVSLF